MDPLLIAIIVISITIGVVVISRYGRKGAAPEEAPEAPEVQPEPTEDIPSEAPVPEDTVLTEEPPTPVVLEQPPAPVVVEEPEIVIDRPSDLEAAQAPVEAVDVPEIEVPEPKRRFVSRITQALSKTRSALGDRLSTMVRRDKLTDEDWDDIEEALIRADLGVKAATTVVDALREAQVAPADLQNALVDQLVSVLAKGDSQLKHENHPSVWLVTGVNGVGKTTSIAKLANRLKSEGKTVVLAAADTFRAAAIDQLGTWADRLEVHMVRHDQGSDPGAVAFDAVEHAKARGVDVVIIDTAGRLHTKTNLMEELKKVKRVSEKDATVEEVLLVLDATVGQNGIAQARTFQEAIDVTGVVLTKLDGTARGGIVVAIQEELGIPVKAIGVGEGLEDLEPFDPKTFAEALVREG